MNPDHDFCPRLEDRFTTAPIPLWFEITLETILVACRAIYTAWCALCWLFTWEHISKAIVFIIFNIARACVLGFAFVLVIGVLSLMFLAGKLLFSIVKFFL